MAAASENQVKNLEKQLKEAVEFTLDPLAAPQLRANAYEFIEQFKNLSPLCADVGLRLFNKENSPIVRHLGLQLLEHCVKFKWNSMTSLQQENLKGTSLELIVNGTKPVLEEPLHIKESLARLVVEIIKREWPQKWESLLQDLTMICNMGDTQKELVLIVFLRLAEDSISMDSHLNQQRKKEITQCLHLYMEEFFNFFIETLRSSTTAMIEMKNNPSSLNESKVLIHQRVAEQSLLTLQGFLDWVKFNILFLQDCILLQILCLLLDEEALKIPACECLLILVSRKGKLDQKLEYGRLFSQDAMQFMHKAAGQACNAEYDEKEYLFLKRLCQVLATLGSVQLIQMWSKERPKGKPETFEQYLQTILTFTKHCSLALSHLTNGLWLTILRNEIMVADNDVKAVMPILLQMAKTKILRVEDPNTSDSPESIFNREDFNSTKEFESVFTQVRAQSMDIVKLITLQFPVETFFQAAEWLHSNIDKIKAGCSSASPPQVNELKVQWEGSCCYMTAVTSKLFLVDNVNELLKQEFMFRGMSIKVLDLAANCIKSLIRVDTSVCNDPSILTNVVDTIQSLLNFLTYSQDLILEVLRKIFSLVTYNTTGEAKGPWTLDVLHTRRRACSALLTMCRSYGNLLVPMFDELKQYVSSLFDEELVTIQDRTTLTEALVIASNFVESNTRTSFISSLLSPHEDLLITNRNVISVEWLIAFLGMNLDPVNYETSDLSFPLETLSSYNFVNISEEISKQRFKLMLAFTTMLAVVRRCRLLETTQANLHGTTFTYDCHMHSPYTNNYAYNMATTVTSSSSERCSIGLMPDGSTSHACNPCISHVLPFLPGLLILTQAVNKLQGPEAKPLIFPAYKASLYMHDSEKSAIFALQNSEGERANEENNTITKTKRYLFHLTDSCYTILGLLGDMMGAELYKQPGLAQFINEQVISSLCHLPNYRMRVVIRHFIKVFITCCPAQYYEGTLVPVLSNFFNFMLQHLENEWQKVRSRKIESASVAEEEKDVFSQEVIQDQLVYLITKDYMDVFYIACTLKTQKDSLQTEEQVEPMKDEEGQESESSAKKTQATEAKLGPLGEILMQTASVNMQLLSTVFGSMTWLDSSACNKAARLTIPFITKALSMAHSMGSSISTGVIEALYLQILKGIQVHGELAVSVLMKIGVVLYELLKPQYPSLRDVLLQATGCSVDDLEAFENVCFGAKARSEKSKKDHFKKLVENIIGKHLGQMFKDEIKIKDLPSLQLPSKSRESSQEEDGNLGLAELFDPKKATELI